MKEYLIQRLSVTDTRRSTEALNHSVREGWEPAHFFRTNQGDLGVVYNREYVVPEPQKKKNKKQEDLDLNQLVSDPELIDGVKDLLS
jgi:hypothetical protein